MVDGDLRGSLSQANDLAKEIAATNLEIQKSKAIGDEPNDLMDRRDLLVEKLGHLLPISVDQRDKDEFMVHVDGLVLVQGKMARSFELKDADGFATPRLEGHGPARVDRRRHDRRPPRAARRRREEGDAEPRHHGPDLHRPRQTRPTARATAPTARPASTSSRNGPSSTTSAATTTATATASTIRPTYIG